MSAKLPEDAAKPLEFLARHRLAATPQNYTLAYVALSDPGSPIGRAVAEIIAEGYRIKQDEADDILEAHGTTTFFGAYERKNGELSAHLRHQTIKNCWPYWDKFTQRQIHAEPSLALDGKHYGKKHHERFAKLFLDHFGPKLK